ncbi:glutathione S-transferase family protein [Roseicyclus sp. F158]|uniref:Glutathione S-transferase family protein n=1 Tax=Tropicimonas omnivorans TaxID=3075590 RepID=A0ABU3DEB9_9RHOB|nr:glutathione S-transferase family protein [Roseicyclus sp. F158]MDT0682059.1 glutathione S-transferase family protein [Roseicyclus sp. F158]
MGYLQNGEWNTGWYDTSDGSFDRPETAFRNWVTVDGSPGPSGEGGFPAESGRYHLYVSLACPWAHRALIVRALKGLAGDIGVSVVHPHMLDEGWTFDDSRDGATGDKLYGLPFLRDIYTKAKSDITGRVTVPVLWDKKRETIVSNESAEIIVMLNSGFDGIASGPELNPEDLSSEIERVNDRVYPGINNGVYKAGFATKQEPYEKAAKEVFATLDWMEELLAERRYLAGDRPTLADIRAFTTLVRFDAVYHGHFKCNRRKLIEYPNLWAYAREIYQWPGVGETVNFDHIVQHYHYSHDMINPNRIVPIGPADDWSADHGRGAAPF